MRTTYRLLTTLVAAGAMFPMGLPAAQGAGGALALSQTNWFWHDQFNGSIGGTGVGQRMPGSSSGTPDGELGIGYTTGKSATGAVSEGGTADPVDTPNKEAYLRWALDTVPTGSTVNSFTFTIFLDPQRSTPQGQTPIQLVACGALNDWTEGAPPYGDPFSGKPADDCTKAAAGTWNAANSSYSFTATEIAQIWATSGLNLGLGIRQKPGLTTPFQFNVKPELTTASIDFTPPIATGPDPVPTDPPTLPPAPVDDGVDVAVPPVVPVGQPPAPQPQPQPQPQPTVAKPPQQTFVPQADTTPFNPDMTPNGALWAGLFALLGLLVVTSLVLGDPTVAPVTVTGRESDLDRALRTRRRTPAGRMRARPV